MDNGPISEAMSKMQWTSGSEMLQNVIGSNEMQAYAQLFDDGNTVEDHLQTLQKTPYGDIMEHQRRQSHSSIGKKLLDAIPARSILTTMMRSGRMVHWTLQVKYRYQKIKK
jgi:hypothetical protein